MQLTFLLVLTVTIIVLSIPVYRVICIVLLALLNELYSDALQITELYCIVSTWLPTSADNFRFFRSTAGFCFLTDVCDFLVAACDDCLL